MKMTYRIVNIFQPTIWNIYISLSRKCPTANLKVNVAKEEVLEFNHVTCVTGATRD